MSVKLNLEPIALPGISPERPLIMAGPCSAESEEQVLTTARQLASQGVKIYRAGIWKPRTRPNAFEGVGSVGLPWLKKVKEQLGMYTATEVANVKHVYEALKYGVDILWIGARTTANPFAVQEIADTLKGMDIPILVKNPVNPDIELWIGALERLNDAGIRKLAAIHRGFSSYDKSVYRNDPHWQIPIELKRRIPNLQIIVDPSHIGGKRELIYDISQRAMDLNFDGLIIESHCNPEQAWSDAKQQVTPDALKCILDKLILRHSDVDKMHAATLEELRLQIDKYDDEILNIFEQRMKIAEQIGKFKKDNNITILQAGRWDAILNKRTKMGLTKGLSEDFVLKVFAAIHQESINHQTAVMNE
ncbi:MAG TPA: bifunctional 3-deoxy-7-phosphoheptulonate synthase/chorismate mutase type II [Bacteroidales bacterium]|nr:bifunctional 3-deoxy-7-phosphoheptulonate synthase/chorismate mutase type II [Bacteroidales bacterium]